VTQITNVIIRSKRGLLPNVTQDAKGNTTLDITINVMLNSTYVDKREGTLV